MNWVFKFGENFKSTDKEGTFVVTFQQKRKFSGKNGDDVLILDKESDGWVFTDHYKISGVEIPKQVEGDDKTTFNVTVDLVEHYEEAKPLEDYAFSIRRVTNYDRPIMHFRLKSSKLSEIEFEAIDENKIYTKRTIVGLTLKAMHRSHQQSFLTYVASENPSLLAGPVDMEVAFSLLRDYLNFAVIKPAQYLVECSEMLQQIGPEELPQIGFGEGSGIKGRSVDQMLLPQVGVIREYLPVLQDLEKISLRDDPRFRKMFRNSRLPLTLRRTQDDKG
jgi:hypothetical protein